MGTGRGVSGRWERREWEVVKKKRELELGKKTEKKVITCKEKLGTERKGGCCGNVRGRGGGEGGSWELKNEEIGKEESRKYSGKLFDPEKFY